MTFVMALVCALNVEVVAMTQKRVKVTWDVSLKGVVVREGPEVSEVKLENGQFRFITNDQLAPIRERERLK